MKTIFYCTIILFGLINVCESSPFDLKFTEHEAIHKFIAKQNNIISKNPNLKETAKHYVLRGDAFFLIAEFKKSVDDYATALKLDDQQIEAYLGKGLSLARSGLIKESIAQLDIYIERNPNSSLAYTKRGVRQLWLAEQDSAQKDFEKALEIDPSNAEAHDDLGVVYSKKKMYFEAADHFLSAIEYDPTYQKAYHNLALISYLTGKDQLALGFVNSAVDLDPNSKDTLLLKSQILLILGHEKDAKELKEYAEFLPEGNWSEHVPIQ